MIVVNGITTSFLLSLTSPQNTCNQIFISLTEAARDGLVVVQRQEVLKLVEVICLIVAPKSLQEISYSNTLPLRTPFYDSDFLIN